MKIGPDTEPATAISAANADTIIVRGHDLDLELMGRISFTDHVWLLIVGTLRPWWPSPNTGWCPAWRRAG
jgi:citrate synthase